MKVKNDITICMLMGLPGSGKTTLAKSLKSKQASAKIVSFDMLFTSAHFKTANSSEKERKIREIVSSDFYYSTPKTAIFDGLFLTEKDVIMVMKAIQSQFRYINVVIHQFNEDRDTCLKNDGGRREDSSAVTIMNAEYEMVDTDHINKALADAEINNVKVTQVKKHHVILKPDWERFFRSKAFVHSDGKLRSQKWCTGGTYGSCWSDSLSPISGDEQPDFEELDNLLSEICPNITFLQYKRLFSKCVSYEESYESDYYGGGCNYKRYVCDAKSLYEFLESNGYVKNTDERR